MSSDLFLLDDCFDQHHHHSALAAVMSPEDVPSLLGSDPFSALPDVSLDSIFQEIPGEPNPNPIPNLNSTPNLTPVTQTSETWNPRAESQARSIEQIAQTLLTNSPPSHQLEGLSLYQQTHFPNLPSSLNLSNGYVAGDVFGVKTGLPAHFFSGHSYGGGHDARQLQRSLSCGAHFYENPWFCFQPSYHSVLGSPAFLGSENNFGIDRFRRTYSTGDIQVGSNTGDNFSRLLLVDEASIKTERYSAEERKEKIEKYRAKRCLRNFSKTIKYVCRKTLADSRPRVRGRFARNDEV